MSFVKIWSQFYSLLRKKRTMRTLMFSQRIFFFLKGKNFLIKAIYLMGPVQVTGDVSLHCAPRPRKL